MEQKAKFIIIGLATFTLVCLFLFILSFSSKTQVVRERDALKTENTTLTATVNKLTSSMRNYESSMRNYESKVSTLNSDLDSATQQKVELEKKFEGVNSEKDNLTEKLKGLERLVKKLKEEQVSQKAEPVAVAPRKEEEVPPQVNDVYWAGVLKAKGELEFQINGVRNELKSLQIANEQLQREKINLELDLKNISREKEDLKRQFDYNQKLVDSIAQELVREKNDKKQVNDNYKKIKGENLILSRQLKSLSMRKVTLERKVQVLQEGKEALGSRLSEMETMLSDKVSQTEGIKQKIEAVKVGVPKSDGDTTKDEKKDSVELPAIVVRPQSDLTGRSENPDNGVLGKVLAVNKESNFVIIDLGQESGLKIGDIFKIYRREKPIASVEVIQVRRNIAACDIKRELLPIKIGDAVK